MTGAGEPRSFWQSAAQRPEPMARIEPGGRKRLPGYKCPRQVRFVDARPRDPNGKLYKRRLRDPYWEGRERRI